MKILSLDMMRIAALDFESQAMGHSSSSSVPYYQGLSLHIEAPATLMLAERPTGQNCAGPGSRVSGSWAGHLEQSPVEGRKGSA